MSKHQREPTKRRKVEVLSPTTSKTVTANRTYPRSILKKSHVVEDPAGETENKKPSVKSKGKEKAKESLSPSKKEKEREKSPPPTSTNKKQKKKNVAKVENEYHPPTSFKIVVGTYEKLLYGLNALVSTNQTQNQDPIPHSQLEITLQPIFAFPAHVSCIKSVAASPQGGKWLATGSADEIIKVWDLRRRKEVGGLMHHQGSITHLHFPSRSHLLSASEDGTLCLFHARDWTVLRTMKGHKARVNAVAVHPSGKVALSVGKDRTLRMWDLMRGKGCASTKLGKEGEIVRWSTDGSRFVVQSGSTMDVYDTSMKLLCIITHPSRLHDVKFCPRVSDPREEILLAGGEDGKLSVYEIPTDPDAPPRIIAQLVGHERRVKAVQTITIQLPPSYTPRRQTTFACTASSDGKIRVFDLASLPRSPHSSTESNNNAPVEIEPVAEYDTKGTRLTCLTVADGDPEGDGEGGGVAGKRKRDVEDDDGNGDGDGDGDEDSEDEEIGGGSENEDEEEEEEEEWGGLENQASGNEDESE
ncbi:hypothetical protein AMATHDRAFT_145511 [Amanita thiersii Skay4041]|uniref:Uncharacterized protein n=1 Tax=Amanita thiersii Skay4041 TaxID=703135 RepID=A0A2A9NPY7_9AGAR|nr:hypothetical protein AMATHDRAFT_145511 [Amanita thiersii Skay4041]